MDKLKNIKDYITSLNNSELYNLKEFLDLEIRLSEISIGEGQEKRR